MRRGRGFTLTELAVVMAIVALLLGGLMFTLSAQTEQRDFEETRRRLDRARELVLSFAVVKGRLPCPARSAATASPATTTGEEVVTTATGCVGDSLTDYYGGTLSTPTVITGGYLPAKSIGFTPTDVAGFAIDAWGNRIRYAVARLITNCSGSSTLPHFVNSTNLKANGLSCQSNDLLICKSATAPSSPAVDPSASPPSCGAGGANQLMTTGLVAAIIFSAGKNGATTSAARVDEAANIKTSASGLAPTNNALFVWHTPTPSTATNGEFDDQFTWITVGELYGKLIAAGVLP